MLKRIDLKLGSNNLNFASAKAEAVKAASREESDPTLLSWYDHRQSTHSPNYLTGADNDAIVRDYGDKWGGELEVDVNEDYAFIFIDGATYDKYGNSPYRNIEDARGEWYMCLSSQEVHTDQPSEQSCSHLDEVGRGG